MLALANAAAAKHRLVRFSAVRCGRLNTLGPVWAPSFDDPSEVGETDVSATGAEAVAIGEAVATGEEAVGTGAEVVATGVEDVAKGAEVTVRAVGESAAGAEEIVTLIVFGVIGSDDVSLPVFIFLIVSCANSDFVRKIYTA